MKIKVINKELSHYDEELKVTKLNYDMVAAQSDNGKLYFNQEDVKIIPENDYEKAILRCKDIIKIKLHRGISLLFYTAVLDCLEKTSGSEVKSIDLLKDEYRPLRKGLWEKLMLMVINEREVFTVSVVGRKYGQTFDITIAERRIDDFVDECEVEIEWLNKEIDDKKNLIGRYKKAVKDVVSNHGKVDKLLLLSGKVDKVTSCSI